MKSISHLRFCIVGGRAFGKTHLVTSLVRLAGGSSDNTIEPASNTRESITEMQKILDKGHNLEGTSWNDVKDFGFRIAKKIGAQRRESQDVAPLEERGWHVTFTDYPGELFEEYINSMDSQTSREAKKLMRRMESSDGLIILLPRNIHDYGDTLRIYRDRLGDFLTKVLDRRPNLPVCLAVNKWDLCDEPEDKVEELLSEDKVFSQIRNTVHGLCKNAFHLPVSAFGRHALNDPSMWDSESDPLPTNVLEMLFELSSRAEANRIEELTVGWEDASGLAKTFVWPWKASSVCRKGFSLAVNRLASASICRKAFGRLTGAVAGLAILGFGIWTAACAVQEFVRFSNIDKDQTAYEKDQFPNLDKSGLSRMKNSLGVVSWVDHVFFKNKQASLQNRRDNLESRFNESVYSTLLAKLDGDDLKDKDAWELSTDDRRKRSEWRQKTITEEKKRLTDMAIQLQYCDKLVERETTRQGHLDENKPFYDDLFGALKRPPKVLETEWTHQLPRRIKSLQDSHIDKQESHPNDWDKLNKHLAEAENTSSNDLAKAIADIAQSYPSSDWRSEVAKTTKMTNLVANARVWFAESSPVLASFEAQSADWAATNAYWLHYGPFDDAVAELDRKPETGKILAIEDFLAEHQERAFPLRAEVLKEIAQDKDDRINRILATFREETQTDSDNETEPFAVRVFKAQQRIEAADRALKELPNHGQEYQEVSSVRNAAKQFITDHEADVKFEERAKQELERGTIRSIWDLLRDPKWQNETAYKKFSTQLHNRVAELEKSRKGKLDKELSDNGLQDDTDATMEERIRRRNQKIGLYERALQDFAENTDAYREVSRAKEDEEAWVKNHEHYKEFDAELAAIPRGDARIRGLSAFLNSHNETEFPESEYRVRLAVIRNELGTLETNRMQRLNKVLADPALKDDEDASMETRIGRRHQIIAKCDEALFDFEVGTPFFMEVQNRKSAEEDWIAKHKNYVKFDEDLYGVSDGEMRARELEAFLKTHTEKDYPEYTTCIANARTELDDLIESAKTKLTNLLDEIRKNAEGASWKARVASAQKRIDILEENKGKLPESMGKWVDGLVHEEENLIEELQEQGKFTDAYDSVIDNSDTNQWLKAIHGFRQRFNDKDYPSRTNEFANLELRQTAAEDAFNSEYRELSESAERPAPRDFSAWGIFHRNLANKAEEIRKRCATNSSLLVKFGNYAQDERNLSDVFAQWAEVQHRANSIKNEVETDDANTRNVLLLIQGFHRDYSRTNDIYSRLELDEEYRLVQDIKTEFEQKWAEELEEKMKDSDQSDQLALLDEYLPVFCPPSNYHDIYKTKRNNLYDKMSREKKIEAIKTEAYKCLANTEGDQLSAADIVVTIENFFNGKDEDLLRCPELATICADLNNRLAQARNNKLWQEQSALADSLITSGIPKTDKVTELMRYKSECTQAKAILQNLGDSRGQAKIEKLDARIRGVETIIGDGSFKKIEDAEEEYKASPSERTLKRLKDLLDSFDPNQPGNADKAAKVDEKKTSLKDDRRLLDDVKRSYNDFLRKPSSNSFSTFVDSYEQLEKHDYAKHREIDTCRQYIKQVNCLSKLSCAWTNFDLRKSNYRNVRTQVWQHFQVKVNGILLYEKEDIKLIDEKEFGDPRSMKGNLKCGSDTQPFSVTLKGDNGIRIETLVFTIIDQKRMAVITGDASIDLYAILASGSAKGKCVQTLSIKGTDNFSSKKYGPPTREATFTFEFSGIPTLKLE